MSVLDLSPVLPVVVIEDPLDAVNVARALLDGGIPAIEVTLRSEGALDAVRRIAASVPAMTVGVGTVCRADQVKLAAEAGAQFLVSPGATEHLLDGLLECGLPFLAGVATPSEMIGLLERGVTEAKLFPAVAVGGLALLRSVQGPLPGLRFCPTGGITPENAPDFLALANVGCVGGSWLTPPALIEAGAWDRISELAAEASVLGRSRIAEDGEERTPPPSATPP